MEIHGFQKLTLLDYPEHIAATVFTGGCNFRCPFCHNADLVVRSSGAALISEEEVLSVLKKRKGMLEGVCITGGEPALQRDLRDFIRKLKALGYLVKLDTNGYRPDVLEGLLAENLLDYVAMDIKASVGNYPAAAGCPGIDMSRVLESIGILKQGKIPYEFRTTVVKGIHSVEEFEEIGKLLAGCRAYYLQSFRDGENVLCGGYEAFPAETLKEMAAKAGKYIDRVAIRGVD